MIQAAAICATLLSASAIAASAQMPAAPAGPPPTAMSLTSTAFTDGGIIPDKYTQTNPNAPSPPLTWGSPPPGTVTFALIMHDVDISAQKSLDDALHWAIFNIPGTARSLPEGVPNIPTLPDGSIQVKGRVVGYMRPGAPGNVYHHYILELYALDTKLALGPDATRADLLKAMDGHILGKGIDTGRFHRPPP